MICWYYVLTVSGLPKTHRTVGGCNSLKKNRMKKKLSWHLSFYICTLNIRLEFYKQTFFKCLFKIKFIDLPVLLWSMVWLHRHPPAELAWKRKGGHIQQGFCSPEELCFVSEQPQAPSLDLIPAWGPRCSWMTTGTFGGQHRQHRHPCPQLGCALGLCCPHTRETRSLF